MAEKPPCPSQHTVVVPPDEVPEICGACGARAVMLASVSAPILGTSEGYVCSRCGQRHWLDVDHVEVIRRWLAAHRDSADRPLRALSCRVVYALGLYDAATNQARLDPLRNAPAGRTERLAPIERPAELERIAGDELRATILAGQARMARMFVAHLGQVSPAHADLFNAALLAPSHEDLRAAVAMLQSENPNVASWLSAFGDTAARVPRAT